MYTLAHLHLLINHLPIFVPMLGACLLAAGLWWRSESVGRAGLVFLVGGALATLATYLSGQRSGRAVRGAPGVTPAIVGQHASAALFGLIALGVVGLFALVVLWRYRRALVPPRWTLGAALAGAVVASGVMSWVGLLGGAIRHTEVRTDPPPDFGVTAAPAVAAAPPAPVAAQGGPARH